MNGTSLKYELICHETFYLTAKKSGNTNCPNLIGKETGIKLIQLAI